MANSQSRYRPCGHVVCSKCDPAANGTYKDFRLEFQHGHKEGWKCLFCGSEEPKKIDGVSKVRTAEIDHMCERFQSILDPFGVWKSSPNDSTNDREVAGLV